MSYQPRTPADHTVLLYSDNPVIRSRMRMAIGRRPAADVGTVEFREASAITEVVAAVDNGEVDVLLLDAEAQPTGGLAISRQLKNEVAVCPPICIVLERKVDRWLAAWSGADATLAHPLDPVVAARTVADLLRLS